MANNAYVNKVVYGNQTVMDISDTTATAADVADGEVFYTASGQRVTGSYAPTSLAPSNSTPATITSGNDYHATAGGYAIASYNNVTPSNSSPVALTSGDIDKMGGNGYAIQSYSSKTPSSTPASVSSGDIVKMGGSGYLINTYSEITPSTDATYFSSGMKRMMSSGYVYSQQPTIPIYTNFTTTTINVYNQTGHKWTYTFDANKLYTLSMSGQSAYASKRWLIQNGARTVLTDNSGNGVTVTWDATTSTITVTASLAYTVTMITIE